MLYPTELLTNLSISKAGLEPATLRVTGDNPRASARTNCSQSTGKLISLGWFRFTVDNPEPIGPHKNLV